MLKSDLKTVFSSVIKNMGSTLGACGDVNRNVMGPAAPFKNKPEYVLAQKCANDIADLLAPQSGAYYDIWLDGEKFVSVYNEVRNGEIGPRGVMGKCAFGQQHSQQHSAAAGGNQAPMESNAEGWIWADLGGVGPRGVGSGSCAAFPEAEIDPSGCS